MLRQRQLTCPLCTNPGVGLMHCYSKSTKEARIDKTSRFGKKKLVDEAVEGIRSAVALMNEPDVFVHDPVHYNSRDEVQAFELDAVDWGDDIEDEFHIELPRRSNEGEGGPNRPSQFGPQQA